MLRYLLYLLLLNQVSGYFKYNIFYGLNKINKTNKTNFTFTEINDNYLVSTDYIF